MNKALRRVRRTVTGALFLLAVVVVYLLVLFRGKLP